MNYKEKELFLNLSVYKNANKKKIEKLIGEGNATTALLGEIMMAQTAGVAYKTLCDLELIDKTDREFRNTLKSASLFNEKLNEDYLSCIKQLSEKMDSFGIKYAMLDGAYICNWYQSGCRSSDTVEILVLPKDIRRMSFKLKRMGFEKSKDKSKDGREIKPSRRIRFVKDTGLRYMKTFNVELVSAADSRRSDIIKKMLDRPRIFWTDGVAIKTPDRYDFALCLCARLFERAKSMSDIRSGKDMPFAGYCDLYTVLRSFSPNDSDYLLVRAKENRMEDVFYYCLNSIKSFFGARSLGYAVKKSFLFNYVFDRTQKKVYRYAEEEPVKLLFCKDRAELLREIVLEDIDT